ncbi:hypothetical protein E2P81_ATG03766 [Venturia nashicola]|nr:hypothetical protein E2P81_ATG03766 [Venturia nashicola]
MVLAYPADNQYSPDIYSTKSRRYGICASKDTSACRNPHKRMFPVPSGLGSAFSITARTAHVVSSSDNCVMQAFVPRRRTVTHRPVWFGSTSYHRAA